MGRGIGQRELGLASDDPRLTKRLAEGYPVRLVTADTAPEHLRRRHGERDGGEVKSRAALNTRGLKK